MLTNLMIGEGRKQCGVDVSVPFERVVGVAGATEWMAFTLDEADRLGARYVAELLLLPRIGWQRDGSARIHSEDGCSVKLSAADERLGHDLADRILVRIIAIEGGNRNKAVDFAGQTVRDVLEQHAARADFNEKPGAEPGHLTDAAEELHRLADIEPPIVGAE